MTNEPLNFLGDGLIDLAVIEECLLTFLTRSHSHPLRIRIHLKLGRSENAGRRRLLTCLLWPQSHCWQSFSLDEIGGMLEGIDVWTDDKVPLKANAKSTNAVPLFVYLKSRSK
ncbi:hypothetical protein BDV98DRAFT_124063 [Pterulicium gracile]|uniref:RNase III domain-containing protein n=1 Tax=Pterulicium gracile TaxID=1884261 RepID=A0A5C3QFC5_9AGAR|nr:hypothetical protein BDV98DRAFT_124063 [Pterula gracilis]